MLMLNEIIIIWEGVKIGDKSFFNLFNKELFRWMKILQIGQGSDELEV